MTGALASPLRSYSSGTAPDLHRTSPGIMFLSRQFYALFPELSNKSVKHGPAMFVCSLKHLLFDLERRSHIKCFDSEHRHQHCIHKSFDCKHQLLYLLAPPPRRDEETARYYGLILETRPESLPSALLARLIRAGLCPFLLSSDCSGSALG